MRYALFADIHSNLEACQAVLEAIKKEKIDEFVCAGDIVGYGADPGECISLIRSISPVIVSGNHDWSIAGKFDIACFNIYAKEAILWTRENLTQVDKDYLGCLGLIQSKDTFILVHGSLDQPEEFRYILDVQTAEPSFRLLEKEILFVAHSHIPFVLGMKQEKVRYLSPGPLTLSKEEKYIINVGSVGQPRDGNYRACYVVYDSESNKLEFKRVEYDIQTAQRKIIKAGLPKMLAERLLLGK